MDSVDWAMNAAQINRDIRLANEHLPPGMQVRNKQLGLATPADPYNTYRQLLPAVMLQRGNQHAACHELRSKGVRSYQVLFF